MEGLVFGLIVTLFLLVVSPRNPRLISEWCDYGMGLSVAALVAVVAIVLSHEGNHMAGDPWLAAVVFLPSASLGALTLYRKGSLSMAWNTMLVGLSGLGYLWYIDYTNTLLDYTRWIHRGAP